MSAWECEALRPFKGPCTRPWRAPPRYSADELAKHSVEGGMRAWQASPANEQKLLAWLRASEKELDRI